MQLLDMTNGMASLKGFPEGQWLQVWQAPVMASSQQVDLGVRGHDPEPIVLPPERLHARALGHVPHADALVL